MAECRIVSWNVNGIRACLKKGFKTWLQESQPDIICLQESRALPEQLSEEDQDFPGYQCTWHPAERKGYSGVMTLYKEEPQRIKIGLGKKEFDIEGRCLETEFADFTLFNVYVPNGGRDLSRVDYKCKFYDTLLKRAKKLMKEGRHVLITGDWNTCHQEIDLARPKANIKNTGFLPEERAWIDKFIKSGLVDSFRQQYPELGDAYTWWSQRGGARQKNVGWRLDYFLANEASQPYIQDNIIHAQTMGSDHCPIELVWKK
ncbi:MAG: exodeoxyribonuclease III [Planctomycetes bacterium]|nr:exodeoxyribonuclease III [Planctomycetota bacterium]